MSNFDTIIDLGSKNLRISVFNQALEAVYFSNIKINEDLESHSSEKALKQLIRNAEKNLSTHLVDVNILYDTPKYNFLELSIKKNFDQPTFIKKQYESLVQEANYIVSENNFKNQIIHSIVNKIIIDDNQKLKFVSEDIKIESLILEIKFICLDKLLINEISQRLKKNNLNILNLYCSSYVKSIFYNKKIDNKINNLFLDIGFKRTTALFYKDNKFEYLRSIPIGSHSITKDISKVLKLNINYSEELKIKFSRRNNTSQIKNNNDTNLYSEILKKNISIDILKQIIAARIDEIIDLTITKDDYFKKIYYLNKPSIIFIGNGSKLLINKNSLNSQKIFSEQVFFEEDDKIICDAGINYHKSPERVLIQTKKKPKKTGFFENFFNLFSK